jgi:hypothetical protein
VKYVSRAPRPPLRGLIDDLYYLEGAPPYPRLTLPPMPSAVLIVNLGAPFRIRSGADVAAAGYADGVVITTLTRAMEFGYPAATRSVGVHFKPWGLAPFLPLPAVELRDRPLTLEAVWGRAFADGLRDRLATAAGRPASAAPIWPSGSRMSSASRRSGSPARIASPRPSARSMPRDRSTGSTSPLAPATTTRPTSATTSGRSRD